VQEQVAVAAPPTVFTFYHHMALFSNYSAPADLTKQNEYNGLLSFPTIAQSPARSPVMPEKTILNLTPVPPGRLDTPAGCHWMSLPVVDTLCRYSYFSR
jgi:hypothetical protein